MQIRRGLRLGAFLAILTLGPIASGSAAPGQVYFTPATQTVTPFDTFEVSIAVDAALHNIHCFRTQVNFIRPNVRILDIREGPLLSGAGGTFFFSKDTMGVYDIFSCILGNGLFANGPGVLATIKFVTDASPCTTPLQFSYVQIEDPLLDSMTVSSVDGIVIVPSCCDCSLHGDINGDGAYDVLDVVGIIDHVFNGAPQPPHDPACPHKDRGDYNCDGSDDVLDVVYVIDLAFSGGAFPCDPCLLGSW